MSTLKTVNGVNSAPKTKPTLTFKPKASTATAPTTTASTTTASTSTTTAKSQPTTKKRKSELKSSKENVPQKIRLAAPRADGTYALDDWVPAQMGFRELYECLKPESSEVDRICKFLLDLNFPIRYLNVVYFDKSRNSVWPDLDEIKSKCPNFKCFRFASGHYGDDPMIMKRLNQLVAEAGIQSTENCYLSFLTDKKVNSSLVWHQVPTFYLT